jgi:hypothetical protein
VIDNLELVFSEKSFFCRKCFKSFTTFSEKLTTFLNDIDKVLSKLIDVNMPEDNSVGDYSSSAHSLFHSATPSRKRSQATSKNSCILAKRPCRLSSSNVQVATYCDYKTELNCL